MIRQLPYFSDYKSLRSIHFFSQKRRNEEDKKHKLHWISHSFRNVFHKIQDQVQIFNLEGKLFNLTE